MSSRRARAEGRGAGDRGAGELAPRAVLPQAGTGNPAQPTPHLTPHPSLQATT